MWQSRESSSVLERFAILAVARAQATPEAAIVDSRTIQCQFQIFHQVIWQIAFQTSPFQRTTCMMEVPCINSSRFVEAGASKRTKPFPGIGLRNWLRLVFQ